MPARLTSLAVLFACALAAQQPARTIVDPAGVQGTRIIAGGGALPQQVMDTFFERAGGTSSTIVLIPTASARADTADGQAGILARWREAHPDREFTLLHTRDRATADSEKFSAPLRTATGVWITGGQQARLAAAYVGTRVERELDALLARGGVLGGSSAGAAIQSRTMIASGNPEPVLAQGLDLLPFAIVDQHFSQRKRLPRLRNALAARPAHFGVGIDEGTALVVQGRQMRVLGNGRVTLLLPPAAGSPEEQLELESRQVADLVSWQRAARDRARPAWPPASMADPVVAEGSLVIVGGGSLPKEVLDRFVELAGGDDATIVLVPNASPRPRRGRPDNRLRLRASLEARGAEVRILDCEHPDEVTQEALRVLDDATGIWFGGGRQWRLCDAFDNTNALERMHAVLARGGVIGGSSAGATIQGEFLVRGNPLGNQDMWCEGYERGFAFLPGCAIDQHFVARNRMDDLRQLIERVPQVIGLGIDEGTAAIVQGNDLEVLGASKIAVFDLRRRGQQDAGSPAVPAWLAPGDRWNLLDGTRK